MSVLGHVSPLGWLALVIFAIQNGFAVLIMRWSKVMAPEPYSSQVAVLMQEVAVKLPISAGFYAFECGGALRAAAYTTSAAAGADAGAVKGAQHVHASAVVGLAPVPLHGGGGGAAAFQLASMDDRGLVAFWLANDAKGPRGGEPGLSAAAKDAAGKGKGTKAELVAAIGGESAGLGLRAGATLSPGEAAEGEVVAARARGEACVGDAISLAADELHPATEGIVAEVRREPVCTQCVRASP